MGTVVNRTCFSLNKGSHWIIFCRKKLKLRIIKNIRISHSFLNPKKIIRLSVWIDMKGHIKLYLQFRYKAWLNLTLEISSRTQSSCSSVYGSVIILNLNSCLSAPPRAYWSCRTLLPFPDQISWILRRFSGYSVKLQVTRTGQDWLEQYIPIFTALVRSSWLIIRDLSIAFVNERNLSEHTNFFVNDGVIAILNFYFKMDMPDSPGYSLSHYCGSYRLFFWLLKSVKFWQFRPLTF